MVVYELNMLCRKSVHSISIVARNLNFILFFPPHQMPLCVSPQEAMPVVLKRDSLDAMGPVVGEELLEEAAALAASAEASAKEASELRLPTAPPATSAANEAAGNSNMEEAAASRGVVEGLGESDFELSMTELRNAGLIEGGMAGWTVWSQYD